MKEQIFSVKEKIIQIITEEEQEHHAHKPFMTKVPIKHTPIGYEFHQIEVSPFEPSKALKPSGDSNCLFYQKKKSNGIIQRLKLLSPSFQEAKSTNNSFQSTCPSLRLTQSRKFLIIFFKVRFIILWNVPISWETPLISGRRLSLPNASKRNQLYFFSSRERTRSMGCQLLHECDYNYTKAKFYILFPYYKTYNTFRCHQPLILSEQQMEHKINAHIESLKSSKQNDLMRWVKTIENQMQSRIHISKINNYIQIARHNKYDIPDNIKDIIERSVKIGKQIKKNVLNSKNTLQKLQTLKIQLLDNKIVTNEMIHFEEAVARAEEWIKKQIKFQEEYYNCEETQTGQQNYSLKEKQFFNEFGKIQYRTIQSLVNEYNSLPLNYPSFAKTTLILYEQTNKLIFKIPSLNKAAKTRKSEQGTGVVKLPRKFIGQILNKIGEVPVQHEQFVSFQYTILDGLQQLQRISMFLEDTKFEKNIKNLVQFQKLLSDIPIENDVLRKLNEKIQYYELIDRIKRDISNPAKYDSLKDQLLRLKQKGYENIEHAKLQARVMTCMGWHESQQLIREEKKVYNKIFVLVGQKLIKAKMIKFQTFQAQLFSARNQLNIPEQILKQSEARLDVVSELREKILQILDKEQPNINDFIATFKACYENGISFLQFQQLYQKFTAILILVAKMHYLLSTSPDFSAKNNDFYFTNSQCQKVIQYICERRHQMKDFRTKQTGDEIITVVTEMNFPRNIPQWKFFQQFMRKAQQWSDRAMKIIQDFKNNNNMYNSRQVIEQSRHCLHSKLIQEELNRIQIALKWREKISRKMTDDDILSFDDQHHNFMAQLENDLKIQQTNFYPQEEMMFRALEYMHNNGPMINSILQKIAEYPIQKVVVLKLSEMNKFVKQIDREIQKYQIKDKVIDQLKQQLQIELIMNEDWKQRYLAIKRFQKKKIGHTPVLRQTSSRRKDDDQLPDNEISFDLMKEQKEQDNHQYYLGGYIPKAMQVSYSPSLLQRPVELFESQKKKYIIKNGQFCWYFRMLLMLFEFYNGCKLKFAVQQFIKLKNTLTDIYRLIEKYNLIYEKPDKTDLDFQYLDTQTCKIPIFFKESYLITNKYAQILAWKNMAEHVLKSVPVISMELKARKIEQLRQILQKKKNQEIMNENKVVDDQNNQTTNKRRRKPNQLYQNDDITLFRDDYLISKNKKRKSSKLSHLMPLNGHSSSTFDNDYRSSAIGAKKLKQQKEYYKDERQSLQRIEQLLNDGHLELIIDDPKQYCICRNGVPNQNSLMVCCQTCNQWFHIECVGIKKHQAKTDENYLCVGCKSLMEEYQGNYGYFWDHYQKISQYALIEIYEQGRNLEVSTIELNKITLVYNAMIKWKDETNILLKKLVQQNPTNISIHEQEIYPLYLQSMWLPTVHFEAVHLKRLMRHIRYN